MPFEVKPTDQVIIDRSNVGPDDALRIVTSENQVLYCGIDIDDEYQHLRLIQGAIPGPTAEVARKAARELIASADSDKRFEEWFDIQPDKADGLLAMVSNRLLAGAVIRGGEHGQDSLNVGSVLFVRFSERGVFTNKMNVRIRENYGWAAPGVITRFSPARRFDAIRWAALHN